MVAWRELFSKDQREHGGLLTERDFAEYEVHVRQPIEVTYRDRTVLLPGPSSSGGPLTAYALALLADLEPERLPWGSVEHRALVAEVLAATTRVRSRWDELSETHPADEAVAALLDPEQVARARQHIAERIGRSAPAPFEPPGPASTSHLSVVDGEGGAVTLSNSAGASAGYVVPGTGIIPNNMLGEEDLNPRGFHQGSAGTRITTMMTPTLLLDGRGRVDAALGSGGSLRIRSAILQVLSNRMDFALSPRESVRHPRVHLENDVVQLELGHGREIAEELRQQGYRVNRWTTPSIYYGGVHTVARDTDGVWHGVGDPRRGGAAAGHID